MLEIHNQKSQAELISASALMKSVGILAFAFPIIVVLVAAIFQNCELIQNSISAYYHTVSRNVFVGVLCSIAFSLFAYKGYDSLDNILANVGALCALGIAFFPTSVGKPFTGCIPKAIETGIDGKIHFICAAVLFILLGYFSAFMFTKSGSTMTKQKIKRNTIYKICGYLIFFYIFVLILYYFVLRNNFPAISNYRPVYVMETLSLWTFATSWLTKGGFFFKDVN